MTVREILSSRARYAGSLRSRFVARVMQVKLT